MFNTGIEIRLYNVNELNENARKKAIEEHRQFELSIMQPKDFICGDAEYDTEEKLQEQYESEYDYYLMNDEPIIENIEANDYLFFENGEIAPITTYIKDNKAYKIELKLNGIVYDITNMF